MQVTGQEAGDPVVSADFRQSGGEGMYQMEKIATGVSYSTSAAGTGYWLFQILDNVTPSQWTAIGVLGSLFFGLLTYLTNLYFKIKEDRRKVARGE